MKKCISLSIFLAIVLILIGVYSANAQRVIVTRSTVLVPAPANARMSTNGYWKWSPRFQKYIWVTHSRTRLRVHRGYRVRI
ncbi:MAG: hypothetical protein ING84_14370 [Cytophagales bacterium]|nr:hypothetical protein [Cytophagales bacterium]MCA6368344.1 hypothetical protein [Cytophagales bacterium]MCA6372648.1 hypothetical protein [Cytophagales bacterium]MCA6376277.1 hypothetical protein [Cytophagales bacterium]MCA6385318.1 hypothetical protein [Cytophagales bacterium]